MPTVWRQYHDIYGEQFGSLTPRRALRRPVSGKLLALLTRHGLPALFMILLITSAGKPFPDSLLLVAADRQPG